MCLLDPIKLDQEEIIAYKVMKWCKEEECYYPIFFRARQVPCVLGKKQESDHYIHGFHALTTIEAARQLLKEIPDADCYWDVVFRYDLKIVKVKLEGNLHEEGDEGVLGVMVSQVRGRYQTILEEVE